MTVAGERPPIAASRSTELIDDFRLACVSRAIDDREISMQKQSRVFFQISGPVTRRSAWPSPATCGPATTGSSPTTATRRWCSASASRRPRCCCRPSARPTTRLGGPPDAVALGPARASTSSPSRARPAASASRPSAAPRPAATSCGGPSFPAAWPTATSSPTSASARGRAARASSGRASTRRATCTCRCSTSCPTTASPSRCRLSDQHPAPVAELVAGFRGLEIHRARRHRLLRRAARSPHDHRARASRASVRR